MCTKQIEYQFSLLRGGYTFQATQAKSRESEMNIYTSRTLNKIVLMSGILKSALDGIINYLEDNFFTCFCFELVHL